MAEHGDESLLHTLKRVAAVLKQAEIPFALGGSFAVYAHGGTPATTTSTSCIREEDAERALEALAAAGFAAERPPEDWLVKVYDDGRMVDLIYRPVERPVTDETLADTVVRPVGRDPHAGAVRHPADGAQAAELLPALLRLRPRPAAGPVAAGADRLGAGTRGDRSTRRTPRRSWCCWTGWTWCRLPAPAGEVTVTGRSRLTRTTATSTSRRRSSGCSPRTPASPSRASPCIRRERRRSCSAARWRAPHRRDEILRRVTERFPDVPIACDIGVTRAQAPTSRGLRGGSQVIRIAAVGDVHSTRTWSAGTGRRWSSCRSAPTCCCWPGDLTRHGTRPRRAAWRRSSAGWRCRSSPCSATTTTTATRCRRWSRSCDDAGITVLEGTGSCWTCAAGRLGRGRRQGLRRRVRRRVRAASSASRR